MFIFNPGHLEGGKITFQMKSSGSIAKHILFLCYVGPFCKNPIKAILKGVTCDKHDVSVDFLRIATIPLLSDYLQMDKHNFAIDVKSRSINEPSKGEVHVELPILSKIKSRQLEPIDLIDRFRGICWSSNIPPEISHKTIVAAKNILCKYSSNFYVATDFAREKSSKGHSFRSCSFGITISAETKSRQNVCAEKTFISYNNSEDFDPEQYGTEIAIDLLKTIGAKAYTDPFNQSLLILMMALSEKHVSTLKISELSIEAKYMLRYLKIFFNHTFLLDVEKIK